jgi:CheY-like chemotaxis protein/HPt (histidine-containing phosphotransfer) domain-containing protein
VLVAEDNPFNQRVARLLLEGRGHEATLVGNGRLAVEAARQGTFDLVLMDVQMPEMDGLQATAEIRRYEAGTGHHLPIIALTAHALVEDRDTCLAAGMYGFLPKPIRPEQLWQTIDSVLSRLPPVARSEPVASAARDAPALVLDTAAALARVDGDRQFLVEMATLFRAEYPRLLDEIERGISAGDPPRVARATHSLKNWASGFAAPAAFEILRELERAVGHGDFVHAGELHQIVRRRVGELGPALEGLIADPCTLGSAP